MRTSEVADTACAWLAISGLGFLALGRRRAAGWCFTTIGIGYTGLEWGRIGDARISRAYNALRSGPQRPLPSWVSMSIHGLALVAGGRLLRGAK